ncbi:MAG TPA: MFS transporter [Vicinamibacterales bacterium]
MSPRTWRSVPRNVWYLGATSLLTDLSSEMVASVLPLYLVVHLGLSPLAFGTLDGLYNGFGAATRLAGGVAVDRWQRHKQLAAVGYALSGLCRLGLLVVGRWWVGLAVVVALDRIGKGIRTVPRDALIARSTPRSQLGYAFGAHRALDALGAALGPFIAFGLLALVPRGFDVVFVASFAAAIVGFAVLVLFVENVPSSGDAPDSDTQSPVSLLEPLRLRDFRIAVAAAVALALPTISDAFIYVVLLERLQFTVGLFPLLYVGTSVSFLVLAVPLGLAADRLGRLRVFVLGYCALLAIYVLLAGGVKGPQTVLLAVVLLGAYYAATDGVVVAFATGVLPEAVRGTGLALLLTSTSVARRVASVGFGWVWVAAGPQRAVMSFAVALGLALMGSVAALARVSAPASSGTRPPAGGATR